MLDAGFGLGAESCSDTASYIEVPGFHSRLLPFASEARGRQQVMAQLVEKCLSSGASGLTSCFLFSLRTSSGFCEHLWVTQRRAFLSYLFLSVCHLLRLAASQINFETCHIDNIKNGPKLGGYVGNFSAWTASHECDEPVPCTVGSVITYELQYLCSL